MLALFRKNDIGAVFGLVLIALVCKWYVFVHPPAWAELETMHRSTVASFAWMKGFYVQHTLLYSICSFLVLLFMSFYVNYVVVVEKLFVRKNYLTALAFLIYSCIVSTHNIITIPLISSFLVFIAFAKSISLAQHATPVGHIFYIGALVMLSALLYFPAILFLILFLLLILFLRPFSLREISAYIIGLLTPAYFMFGLVYITGHWEAINKEIFFHFHLPLKITHLTQSAINTFMSLFLLVYAWFVYTQESRKLHITVRKKWNAIAFYFIAAIPVGIFSKQFPGITWVVTVFPFSILLSLALQSQREKINIFTFYFLIIALLCMQWVLK